MCLFMWSVWICVQRLLCLQGLMYASMWLWTPIVPVCVHMYHLWYPIPDCYLLKCLWAVLCGFPSLKGFIDSNVDCHDVRSKTTALPFMCHCHHLFPPSVWKTTFLPFTDMDGWIGHCATVTGPEPPPKWTSSLIWTHSAHPKQLEGLKMRVNEQPGWIISLFNRRLRVHLCKQVKPGRSL